MNSGAPFSENQIEQLVRAALEAEGREVDVPRLVAAIEARLAAEAATVSVEPRRADRPGRTRLVRWCAALAACLLVAGAVGIYFTIATTPASAYSLVESAHTALSKPADRCYRVELVKVPRAWPVLTSGDQTLVWTRGDRFRVITSKQGDELVWGRDEQQRTWVVYDARHGLQFEQNELPQQLAATLSYLSLDVRLLTGQILEDFDLHLDQSTPGGQAGLVTVRATARNGKSSATFHSAELEIEPATNTIRHMVLTQFVNGSERGRFAFTLIGEEPLADASYQLEAQLDEEGKVLSRKQGRERNRKLMEIIQDRARR